MRFCHSPLGLVLLLLLLLHVFQGCDTDADTGEPGIPDGGLSTDSAADIGRTGDGAAPDLSSSDTRSTDSIAPPSPIWATAYYAGWMQSKLPPAQVDYSALTHVIHFALLVQADGTLDDQTNGVHAGSASAVVQAVHAAGKSILISVGGAGAVEGLRSASSPGTRPTLVNNLVQLVLTRGYDGLDLDWEPLQPEDQTTFVALLQDLRAALDQHDPSLLLTAAVAREPSIIAQVHPLLDQINVMTYDLSGPWPGWLTWHNAPIYDGGCVFQSTGQPLPSAHGMLQEFVDAGVPRRKLGIGIDFYGYVWQGGTGTDTDGVTRPCQAYATDPQLISNASYATIMDTYHTSAAYSWDTGAEAAYLSIDLPGAADDRFVSYDDETSVTHKVSYARDSGLGGVFIWELGGGYRPGLPYGLLQALKQ